MQRTGRVVVIVILVAIVVALGVSNFRRARRQSPGVAPTGVSGPVALRELYLTTLDKPETDLSGVVGQLRARVEQDPTDTTASALLGGVLSAKNDPGAVAVLTETLKKNAGCSLAHAFMGDHNLRRGDLTQALDRYREAERKAGAEPVDLILALHRQGTALLWSAPGTDEARAAFDKARQVAKEKGLKQLEALALTDLALEAEGRQSKDEAFKLWEEAWQVHASSRTLRSFIVACISNNQGARAEKLFQEALDTGRAGWWDRYMLMNHFISQGKTKEAEALATGLYLRAADPAGLAEAYQRLRGKR